MNHIEENMLPSFASMRKTLGSAMLVVGLLLAGCAPLQPAPSSTVPDEAEAESSALLLWEGQPLSGEPACAQLEISAEMEATVGACDGEGESMELGATHASELASLQTTLASFDTTVDGATVTFTGTGSETDPAWHAALNAWAQLVYGELSSGGVSAAGATAVSWFTGEVAGQSELCQHVTVLSYGYAYAETLPCAGGPSTESIGGWLTTDELTILNGWLSDYAPAYVQNNYIDGKGATEMGDAETTAVAEWAQAVYARLAGNE